MNLIKLFNPAYLKENIKKSRGFIILFLILVPLFTALITIFEINNPERLNVANEVEIALINIIGMYGIPFILSFALFGYVYKKNSVDFINSMPLNRKTIFVTNTIGGILLITLMQFITALILVICDAVLVNVVIFSKMISDIFILMWISYVFVFIATNLAMTLSGTFLTQVALTLLILFLVPFCIDSYHEFSEWSEYVFVNGENEFTDNVESQEISFTMPYRLISMVLLGNSDNLYSTNSIIRMIVLGILYFGIGIYLFQNRKMEDTEESFSSIKMHIFVKALTIFPMIILLNLIEPDIEFIIFALALIGVYYFVFDFIVKRKVKLKVSILSFILILVVWQGICMATEFIREKMPTKTLNKEDVIAVSIGNCRNYSSGSWYYYRDLFEELGYYFENQQVIDLIFESRAYVQDMYFKETAKTESVSVQEITVEKVEKTQEVLEEKSVVDYENRYEPTSIISVTFKTKSGKRLQADIEILEVDFDKIIEILEKDENYVKVVKERFISEGEYAIEHILCDDNTQERIRNEIKSKLEKMSLKEIYTTLRNTEECAVYQYDYKNHTLMTNTFSITITDNLFNLATEFLNQNAVEIAKKVKEEDVYSYFYVEIPETSGKKYTGYTDFALDVIPDFIIENEKEKFDYTQEYYIIRGNVGNYGSIYFYTNKVEEIDKLISIGRDEVYYYEDINY